MYELELILSYSLYGNVNGSCKEFSMEYTKFVKLRQVFALESEILSTILVDKTRKFVSMGVWIYGYLLPTLLRKKY